MISDSHEAQVGNDLGEAMQSARGLKIVREGPTRSLYLREFIMGYKYTVYVEGGVLHRHPVKAYRMTICGLITGIMLKRLTRSQILEGKHKLCKECWQSTAVQYC